LTGKRVNNLLITFAVGTPQRPENKHWRGFRRVDLATMNSQQAVAKRLLLEGASSIRRAFFLVSARRFAPSHRCRDMSLL
jgi:hypothetical protein